MEIDEEKVARIEHIWRNNFALLFADKPRLCNTLKTCTLDIGESEIEPGIIMSFIVFYVQNEAQRMWIEAKMLMELQERFAQMAGLENLTLGVDVDNSEAEISIIDTTPHNPVEITEIEIKEFGLDIK